MKWRHVLFNVRIESNGIAAAAAAAALIKLHYAAPAKAKDR